MNAQATKDSRPHAAQRALVRAAGQGDVAAAEELLRRHLRMARGLALRYGAAVADVEDILQDATVEALVWLPRLRNPESFTSWYGQIVIHVTRAYQRRQRRRDGLFSIDDAAMRALPVASHDAPTPERVIEARQLSGTLDALPEKVRAAVGMRHLEGRRIAEIASELGASPASVKRYLFAAETALRDRLQRDSDRLGEALPPRKPRRRKGAAALVLLLSARRRWAVAIVRRLVGGGTSAAGARTARAVPARAALTLLTVGALLGGAHLHLATRAADGDRPSALLALAPAPPLVRGVTTSGALAPGVAEDETTTPPAAASAVAATTADEFVDRLGVSLRLHENPQDFPLVRARLLELGVRHVIDQDVSRLDWLARLGEDGIRTNLYVQFGTDPHALLTGLGDRSFIEAVTLAQPPRAGRPLAHWALPFREWIQSVHAAMKRDPGTQGVALVGATLADEGKRDAIGDVSAFVDFGGIGAPSGVMPPGGALMDAVLAVYRSVYGWRPSVVPQVSYSTAVCERCVDEETQAKFVVRTFFEHHVRGIVRTYGAYLFDRSAQPTKYEHGTGLARVDGGKKRAFVAVERTIDLVGARGAGAVAGELPVEIVSGPEELEALVVRRRDGSALVAVWLSVAPAPGDPGALVQLRLPSGARALRLHDVVSGGAAALDTPALDVGADGLTVVRATDSVQLLELGPTLAAEAR